MKGEVAYQRLPIFLQNIACSLYGWRERRFRMSEHFQRRYRWLLETESASAKEITAYQDEQVARLIQHAYDTVPYYRQVMSDRGMTPSDITSKFDLLKLPILQKEDVIQHKASFFSTAFSEKQRRLGATSGTTGTALIFGTTNEAVAFQWAIWWRHRHRFGAEPLSWHLNFTGKRVVPPAQTKPPFWRWNYPMRQALVNMQHIIPERTAVLAQFAGSHDFAYYSGYPSIIHAFSEQILANGLELEKRPKWVFLGAEGVQEFQKRTIEAVTGAVVTDQYGFSEGCGNASRCEAGIYHEDWEFGILECGDPEILPDGSLRGKIIATGFANYAFPFIRYEIGDSAIWAPQDYRCRCGRSSPVLLSIDGRNEDFIITPEGARIMRFDYLFKDTYSVKEAQVIQRREDAILIRIAPRPQFSVQDENMIRQKIRDWISPSLDVEFELVNLIPKSTSGKFRPVVSELGNKRGVGA